MKTLAVFLAVLLIVAPVAAQTNEAIAQNTFEASAAVTREAVYHPDLITEFDITFWQTLPFAGLWAYFIASQLSPSGWVDWGNIGYFALGVSVINAALHARKTVAASRNK